MSSESREKEMLEEKNGATKSDFNVAGEGKARKAVILTEARSDPEVIARIEAFLRGNDYDVQLLDSTPENHFKTTEIIKQDERGKSVCYIGGSALGDDPDLVDATKDLVRKVVQSGFNTVFPGSGIGMMGAIADAVKEVDGKLTSVFSLQVAEAYFEEITTEADSIVVAPNEKVW